ncbi:MAG: lipid-A-disaccharide synthase [Fimbriimonadales bacterium]
MNRRVVILSGEASGDLYGADLAHQLRAHLPKVELYGMGGVRMQAEGVTLLADSRSWGAIGIVESLRVLPRVWRVFQRLKRAIPALQPDLVVPIDFGAFNVPMCKWLAGQGVPVVYYVPPGSWRRDRQGTDLPLCTKMVLTPFEWSAQILQGLGANAHAIRHPLLRLAQPSQPKEAFCERLGLDPERPLVALLPGSRRHEVSALVPIYAHVAEQVAEQFPETQFVLSAPSHFSIDWIHELWSLGSRQWVPTETRPVWDLLAHADCAIVCSGTATLEAALLGTPMVIVYRGSALMNLEYRLRRRRLNLTMIGLPNLILNERVCPELIQDDAMPDRMRRELLPLLRREAPYHQQNQAFARLRTLLGERPNLREGYEWILDFLTHQS